MITPRLRKHGSTPGVVDSEPELCDLPDNVVPLTSRRAWMHSVQDIDDELVATSRLLRIELPGVGTQTLIGVGPRSVRSKAKAGWVERRPPSEPTPADLGRAPTVEVALEYPPVEERALVRVEPPEVLPAVRNTNVAAPAKIEPWGAFERIGLGAPQQPRGAAAKLVVSAYRLIGFGVLTLIVAVLVAYIATTVFYFLSHSWVMPVAVSKHDEKVLALQAQLADQQNQRDHLAAELDDTDRAIAAQRDFQSEFAKAIKTDLRGRLSALERVRQLASAAASTRSQIRAQNDAYAQDHADRIAKEYEAGLIDRSAMLSGKQQLAQITTSNLSLAERQAEFEQRGAQLAIETRALDALLANKGSAALSYDVLKIKHDYDTSKLELQKATANRRTLQVALARQDQVIAGIKQASYLRAVGDGATVALVPYDNIDHVAPGTALYACRVEMVACREVGRVLEVLPGEVTFKHPHRDLTLRGQMIELRLTEPDAAAKDVLFLGGAPLWL